MQQKKLFAILAGNPIQSALYHVCLNEPALITYWCASPILIPLKLIF
jgi:hypothetical protein